jgi:putative addiction module killer protein
MFELRQTDEFSAWLRRLKDARAKARIAARIERIKFGNLGDYKSLGGGMMEIRLDFGPGYRVYFVRRGSAIVILLCGGDKRTQRRDIARAYEIAEGLQ